MKKLRLLNNLYLWIAALVLLIMLGGCITPAEKRGYTSLPQNRPTEWESSPFGTPQM